MLTELTEIRAHLERCNIILNGIVASDAEEFKRIETLGGELRNSITATIKAIIATKVAKKMEIVPTQVIPAERIVVERSVDDIPNYSYSVDIVPSTLLSLPLHSDSKLCTQTISDLWPFEHHPTAAMNKVIKTYLEMGGFSLDKVIKPFSLSRPEIELDEILAFLNAVGSIREKNKLYPDCSVYANLCEHSTVYVGIARNEFRGIKFNNRKEAVNGRIQEHRNWPSVLVKANWTAIFRVVSTLCIIPGDKEDEDLITFMFIKCFGKKAVRGGMYTGFGKLSFPDISLYDIKQKLLERSQNIA